MRINNFIRMPLKNGQFKEENNLFKISEVSSTAGFGKGDSCPQSMKIEFNPTDKEKGTQIHLIWSGYLEFEAKEDLSSLKIDNITKEYFDSNDITGSLVITSKDNLEQMNLLLKNIKILKKSPSSVRYEFVKLTTSFLFESLKTIKMKFKYLDETIIVNEDNEMTDEILKKLIHRFILGKVSIPIFQDTNDFEKDFTELDMPIVDGNVLEVSMSSKSTEAKGWYEANENDFIGLQRSDESLVLVANQNDLTINNPRHPSHSIIPCLFILDEGSNFFTNLNGEFEIYFSKYMNERKMNYILLNLLRPHYSDEYIEGTNEINNNPFKNEHRRQYPLHAIMLERKNIKSEYRLPISGLLYVPLQFDTTILGTGNFSLEVTQINFTIGAMTLSKPNTENPNLLMTMGKSKINLNFNKSTVEKIIYVNCLEYDSMMIWNKYVNNRPSNKDKYRVAREYGLKNSVGELETEKILKWYIQTKTKDKSRDYKTYNPLYGYIRESAARHKMSPEFIQTVIMGEGTICLVRKVLKKSCCTNDDDNKDSKYVDFIEYTDDYKVDAWCHLGLDTIADAHPRLKKLTNEEKEFLVEEFDEVEGKKILKYIDTHEASEIPKYPDIGYSYLIENDYFPKDITVEMDDFLKVYDFEATSKRDNYYATIKSWKIAIELTTASLNARLHMMLNPKLDLRPTYPNDKKVKSIMWNHLTSFQRCYLAYVRFNAVMILYSKHTGKMVVPTWVKISNDLNWKKLKFYTSNERIHKEAIVRVAITDWFKKGKYYR